MLKKASEEPVHLHIVDVALKPSKGKAIEPQTALDLTVEQLVARADRLEARELSRNSQRAYRADFAHFSAWCASRPDNPTPLPADPETVRLYLAAHSEGPLMLTAATLRRRLAAITRVHRREGYEPPTRTDGVKNVMSGLLHVQADEGIVPTRKKPLRTDALVSVVLALPVDERKIAVRNRAILLLGFAGGCRRSEIVGLNLADVEMVDEGMKVTIRKSKTDQGGKGKVKAIPFAEQPEVCPVRAYRAWTEELAKAGIRRGPVFYGMARHDQIGAKRLRGEAVAEIVKQGVIAIGKEADEYAGHSLRSGFVTSAYEGGAELYDIARQTGHTTKTLEVYIHDQDLFNRNAVGKTGL